MVSGMGASNLLSLPSRERGLKFAGDLDGLAVRQVAPFTGAWIEIWREHGYSLSVMVAPFTGAWIEMASCSRLSSAASSLPSRERGLKSNHFCAHLCRPKVAPFTGAWIEILSFCAS